MDTTPRKMVLDVILEEKGGMLSVQQIRSLIFEKHATSMDIHTIVKTIDELKMLYWKITEKVERRGKFNLPVKVFGILDSRDNDKFLN